jgi:type IV pilus assembly protein PilV
MTFASSLRPKPSVKQKDCHTVGGFTLVEVLVALLVLSIGLLGLATLQIFSLSLNNESYVRTQSTVLAYDIIDKMRSNSVGVSAGNYDVGDASVAASKVSSYGSCKTSGCKCSGTSSCDAGNLALYDVGSWYQKLDETLPGASSNRATIVRDTSTNVVTITINWVERDVPLSQRWDVQL